MIDLAATFVKDQLAQHLERSLDAASGTVMLAGFHGPNGALNPDLEDKLVITVVSVAQDVGSGRRSTQLSGVAGARNALVSASPLNLTVTMLLVASFSSHQQGLRYLSSSMSYLHARSPFLSDSSPRFPEGVAKLDLQIENLSFHDMSNLWGFLGAKQQPCMAYTMRVVPLVAQYPTAELPTIRSPGAEVQS